MSLVQFNGSPDLQIQTVYYGGAAILAEGQPLYYDTDDTAAPVVNSWDPSVDPGPNSLSPTGNRNLRGNRVVDVLGGVAGSGQFAGVVSKTSAGKAGPTFCEIVRPVRGTVCNVLVGYNTSVKGDILNVDEATPSNTFAKFAAEGVTTAITGANVASVVAVVMQTGPTTGVTTSAPALILAKFI